MTNKSWCVDYINAPFLWLQTSGEGQVIAVLDVDTSHPMFANCIHNPQNIIMQANLLDVSDARGHGTHVAGIVA